MGLLPSTEFDGFYPRDRRTDEQVADDFGDCVESKMTDTDWLRDAFGDATVEPETLKLFAAGDDLAFCARLRETFLKQARNEARREVA